MQTGAYVYLRNTRCPSSAGRSDDSRDLFLEYRTAWKCGWPRRAGEHAAHELTTRAWHCEETHHHHGGTVTLCTNEPRITSLLYAFPIAAVFLSEDSLVLIQTRVVRVYIGAYAVAVRNQRAACRPAGCTAVVRQIT